MAPGGSADSGGREAAEAVGLGTDCDQCGDTCTSPELAVCRSPGCGVEFAQCVRCGVEYDGCCSDACQALVTGPVTNTINIKGATPLVESLRQSELVSPGETDSSDKVVGSFGQRAGVPFDEAATLGSSADGANVIATTDKIKRGVGGSVLSNGAVASVPGPLNGAKNTVATGVKAENGDKKQKEEKVVEEEPVLESYASRHSAPESSGLAGIREATTRCDVGFRGATSISRPFQSLNSFSCNF